MYLPFRRIVTFYLKGDTYKSTYLLTYLLTLLLSYLCSTHSSSIIAFVASYSLLISLSSDLSDSDISPLPTFETIGRTGIVMEIFTQLNKLSYIVFLSRLSAAILSGVICKNTFWLFDLWPWPCSESTRFPRLCPTIRYFFHTNQHNLLNFLT